MVRATIAQASGDDALAVLQSHDWPGNIRQLRNNVERLLILAGGDAEATVTAAMLPPDVGALVPNMPNGAGGEHLMSLPLREARELFEREYLVAQINRFLGVLSHQRETLEQQRADIEMALEEISAHEEECRRLLVENADTKDAA